MIIPTRTGFARNIRYWRKNRKNIGQFESIRERNLQCIFRAMQDHRVPKNREHMRDFFNHLKKS